MAIARAPHIENLLRTLLSGKDALDKKESWIQRISFLEISHAA